jgi:hypothetical protein
MNPPRLKCNPLLYKGLKGCANRMRVRTLRSVDLRRRTLARCNDLRLCVGELHDRGFAMPQISGAAIGMVPA